MTLPNYFLADLGSEARLQPAMITEACQALRRNREAYLAERPTRTLIDVLSRLAAEWREADSPFRTLALDGGPAATGFSRPTLESGLDSFFSGITRESLTALVEQDLGASERLVEFCATEIEDQSDRAAVATGPSLLAHIAAGNLPVPALASLVVGLLARSAQFLKCATGTSFIPRLFAHSIYQADRKLGACLEVADWRGGEPPLEEALFTNADCVTATGTDETLSAIQARLPRSTRFVGYGHRVSFAYVTEGMLTGLNATRVLSRAADDIVAWDQAGCLSPHVLYVEHGGSVAAEQFAQRLAGELDRRESVEPRGAISPEAAATIASRRSFYELRAAHSPETRLWRSPNSTAWTVIYEADPLFQISCLNRFVYVKGVTNLTDALRGADAIRNHTSTVGLAAPEDQVQHLATTLARWGATRICPLGRMQRPPLTWRHDGRPGLGDLVRWTDWERQV